jgi:hypothetical protein
MPKDVEKKITTEIKKIKKNETNYTLTNWIKKFLMRQ